MDSVHACRLLELFPGMVSGLVMECLLALKPQGHLFNVITFVAGSVGVLSVFNVKAFRVFSIVSVSAAERSDRGYIVHERVDLGYVEMIVDAKLDEDIFTCMEQVQALLHRRESLVCVLLEPRIVYEVEQ